MAKKKSPYREIGVVTNAKLTREQLRTIEQGFKNAVIGTIGVAPATDDKQRLVFKQRTAKQAPRTKSRPAPKGARKPVARKATKKA